ncbi:MAG: UvrD-helicase domain-containing protein, partial [bacterium]|nr:UvrD-helicase domain-containing protein [bacterium]
CDLIVTQDEIKNAEKDIFGDNGHYNKEQKKYLKCLDSCTVQAYAGTGKTTTIVGKLHILAQKNIWKTHRGICVISHTNVAVDEIKKHVAKHYPAIMEYPNFIGTIQEFVNRFLFIPYLASQGLQIRFQDETYNYEHNWTLLNNLGIRPKNAILQTLISYEKLENNIFTKIYLINDIPYFSGKEFPIQTINKNRRPENNILSSDLKIINNYFISIINKRRDRRHFLFIESFIDGLKYLKNNSFLRTIIKHRFQFVFLDEAQDSSAIQLKVLKELFDGDSNTIFQQIGDVNQAISEIDWSPNNNYLSLSKSTRFGNNISEFINRFQVSDNDGVSGRVEDTKKYLITYEPGQEINILQKFT